MPVDQDHLEAIQAAVAAALAQQQQQAPPAVPQGDLAAAAAAAVAAAAPQVAAVDINTGRRRRFPLHVRGGVREQENHPRRYEVQQAFECADAGGEVQDGQPSPGAGDEQRRLPAVEGQA